MKKLLLILVALVSLLGIQRSYSLTIIRNFIGGTPPTNSTGSGNWTNIVNDACDVIELIVRDPFVVTMDFGLTNCGGGQHILISQGGIPPRETHGLVQFNNDNQAGHFAWYLSPAPLLNLEATNYSEHSVDLGKGLINVNRSFQWSTVGNEIDLFTVCLHEVMTHGLGMSFGNTSFLQEYTDADIDITSGKYAGMAIPLQVNFLTGAPGNHLEYLGDGFSIGAGSYRSGIRVMPDEASIWAVAQVSHFTQLNTGLVPILNISTSVQTNGNGVLPPKEMVCISWIQPLPAPSGMHYALQSCTSLAQGNWYTVTNPIVNVRGHYSVSIPTTTGKAFFRLKAQ